MNGKCEYPPRVQIHPQSRLKTHESRSAGQREFCRCSREGMTSSTAYDTAWTARILNESGKPVFPKCVRWILENQKTDGSWGSDTLNFHDRIISTLGAVIALKEIAENKHEKRIIKGEEYIWENLENLKKEDCTLIGSELLLPSLMQQAESTGLHVPYYRDIYEKEHILKLRKIEKSLWYSPFTTLSFSLEFLGDDVDVQRLPQAQLPNGSVANSPAATAFFLKHRTDVKALTYLKRILELTENGSVMTVYPIDVFEYGWVIYNFLLAHLYFERYKEVCTFLMSNLRNSGIGCSSESPLTDADDTAVVCRVLKDMGLLIDSEIFNEYYTGEYYQTYNYESDPSVSTNIHMLDLVKNCAEFPDRDEIIEILLHFLKKRVLDGYWVDKWHVSPYYPTSHAVFALSDIDSSLAERAVSWIIDSQNGNGLWGKNGGTLEETAYAVQALMYYHRYEHIDVECVSKAVAYLETFFSSQSLDDLWVGKVLYCPVNVVLSSIASASFMYRTAVSSIPSAWHAQKGECHAV